MVNSEINYVPQSCLIDSGADCNYISHHLVSTLSLQSIPRSQINVRLADGSTVISNSTVLINFKCGQYEDVLEFFVVPGDVGIILGYSWLEKVEPQIDWKDRRVFLNCGDGLIELPSQFGQTSDQNIPNKNIQSGSNIVSDGELDEKSLDFQMVTLHNVEKCIQRQTGTVYLCVLQQLLDQHDMQLGRIGRTAFGNYEEQGKQQQEVDERIKQIVQKYPHIFSEPSQPKDRTIKHHIPLLNEAAPPPKHKQYPMSHAELAIVKEQLHELLEKGWIKPSTSNYAAPILLVKKKSGGVRMCVDYRSLNKQTILDKYPLPLIDDLTAVLGKAKVFSKLDLISGYHQVELNPDDQHKTAFQCRYGLFEYTVLPFGLSGAPGTFQRLMNSVLQPYLDEFVVVYLDDILIFSENEQEHVEHLNKVFQALNNEGLHVKLSKCDFFKSSVDFLGHVISGEGIYPDAVKVTAIQQWPVPRSIKQVQQFLGLCGYYRRYIKNFSKIAQPLTDLTRKNIKWQWSESQQQAFDVLRNCLVSQPVLCIPNNDDAFELETDASLIAVGAVLYQIQNQQRKVVSYFSKRLSDTESRYSAYERELLAILYACKHWRRYIYGKKVVVYTDHKSLKYIMDNPLQYNDKIARWLQTLVDFQLDIQYKAGKTNLAADALSRSPNLASITISGFASTLLTQLKHAWSDASTLSDEDKRVLAEASSQSEAYRVVDGVVWSSSDKLVVPTTMVNDVIALAHDLPTAGHFGVRKTLTTLQQHYVWSTMQQDVRKFVRSCKTCQLQKDRTVKKLGEAKPLPVPTHRFEQVSMDLVTDLPLSQTFDSIFSVVDHFSRWVIFIPCNKTCGSEDLAKLFVRDVIAQHGVPKILISDRDARFVGKFWQTTMNQLGCKLHFTTAYRPQSNGAMERQHRTVEQVLRCFINSVGDDWVEKLPLAAFAMNTSISNATGYSPFFLQFGRQPVSPLNIAIPSSSVESVSTVVNSLQDALDQAQSALQKSSEQTAREMNKHTTPGKFEVGDLVLLSTQNLKFRVSKKFKQRFAGPFKVIQVSSPVNYKLQLPQQWLDQGLHPIFHISLLRPFVESDRLDVFTPDPILIDGSEEYEIDSIIAHRRRGRGTQYLVRWLGYGPEHDSWLSASAFGNAPDVLQKYLATQPGS